MTDHLTEAVRRLRQLQEDVERLKSGGDEGQVRELRRVDDPVAVGDVVVVGPDADVEDEVATKDAVAVGPDADVVDGTDTTESATSRLNDAETSDSSTTTDSATVTNIQTATPAVCDFDNADKSDAG